MWSLKEYQEPRNRLCDLLPWGFVIEKGVIQNKDGAYQSTIQFRGPDLDSSTPDELISISAQINNALKRFGSGWAFFIEAKRKISTDYPISSFPDPVSALIDKERRALFSQIEGYFESEYYLTVTYLPPAEGALKVQNKLIENAAADTPIDYSRYLEMFINQIAGLVDLLKGNLPLVKRLNDEETLTYLHSTISTRNHPIAPHPRGLYLDITLPDCDLKGGLEPMLGDAYLQTITIKSFPNSSLPGILNELNMLPLEYRWVTRFLPLDKEEALSKITSYKRKWFAKRKSLITIAKEVMTGSESIMSDNDALNKSIDADTALQETADDLVSYGYYTCTITLWDEDIQHLREKVREVERVINSRGFTTIRETINGIQAWLGSLPGHCHANIRRPLLNTLNLTHMMPISAVWAGLERNQHFNAPPLLRATTQGCTPFRLVTHMGDVGHTMIVGPTGAGKSVLLSFFIAQFLRYQNAQVYVFDKGRSARAITTAVGGLFYDLCGESNGLAFQPFADIDQENERVWALDWLLEVLANETFTVTIEAKEKLWSALDSLAGFQKEHRTITGFYALIQDQNLRMALQPYTEKGPYGFLLDADKDTLQESAVQCFEMEELMNKPKVIAPVLSYLFHKLEKRFKGKPTLLVLDEAWLFLDSPIFAAKIREWLKVLRKANVSVIFATQSIADIAKSSITASLIESCPTRIFLPNATATEEYSRGFYKSFGLNDKQIQILATATPKKHYYYTSPLGNRLFELHLGAVALAFCGSSSKDDQALIDRILAEHKKANFARYFLEAKGLFDAAQEIPLHTELSEEAAMRVSSVNDNRMIAA